MKKIYKYVLVAFSLIAMNSCAESEISILESVDELGFTGSQEDIIDFLSEDAYNNLLDLGITVNTGSTPPNVQGSYVITPYILANSNIIDDYEPGQLFANQYLYFSNQNTEELSIDYYAEQIDSQGNVLNSEYGVQSFISGSGSNFTIIVKIQASTTGDTGNTINTTQGIAVSGTMVNGGIQNIERAFVIIEKTGDVNDELIEVGDGRLFVDQDGFSEQF